MIKITGYRAAMLQLELSSAEHVKSVLMQKLVNRNFTENKKQFEIDKIDNTIHKLTAELSELILLDGDY